MSRRVYLDASALVKLAVAEPESSALAAYLEDAEALLTSAVAAVEVPRAVRTIGASKRALAVAADVLARCYRIELDSETSAAAAGVLPPELRTLDAIHLASALRVRSELDACVVYDRRLAAAAVAAGLPTVAPGRSDDDSP